MIRDDSPTRDVDDARVSGDGRDAEAAGDASRHSVTQVLAAIERGDAQAADQLLPLVYDELRRLAAAKISHERPGQTLQGTALVHEAYLRLTSTGKSTPFNSRGHFFAAAGEAMRQILVDRAREKISLKRGGGLTRRELESDEVAQLAAPEEVVSVHDALDALAVEDALAAQLVKLRYFIGFSMDETADILQLSRPTAYRLWTFARAWLRAALRDGAELG
jgi:RNA polymerase sigma factor (TIGR02999 family)